jgi:hypothetical protein
MVDRFSLFARQLPQSAATRQRKKIFHFDLSGSFRGLRLLEAAKAAFRLASKQ